MQLDGEISGFEHATLDAHLLRCASCRVFSADVGGFTGALRQAPPEVLGRRVLLPRPTRGWKAPNAAAAAAAVLVVALGAVTLLDSQRPAARPPAAGGARGSFDPVNELAWFKRFPVLSRSNRGHTVI